MSKAPFIETKGLSKSFGSKVVNNDINLTLEKGKIYALLGENGAGKSTLMKMLSGFLKPDKGVITVKGKAYKSISLRTAQKLGIAMVYQHFQLIENFTAQQNIMLGRKEGFFINNKKSYTKLKKLSEDLQIKIKFNKKIEDMSVSEKQAVEIFKMLYEKAQFIILDEPTAVLSPPEVKNFFKIINNLKSLNYSILLVTHKLDEILQYSDEILILRKGEIVKQVQTSQTNTNELSTLMMGTEVTDKAQYLKTNYNKNILQIKNLTIANKKSNTNIISNLNLSLNSGEILGVAAIAGSGQKELCEAISGIQMISSGEIIFNNISLNGLTPRKISDIGIGMSFVPEDRLGMGLIADFNINDNILLKLYHKDNHIFIRRHKSTELTQDLIKKLQITPQDDKLELKKFSGGNIQKVLLGRELELKPQLLIVAYPTRGLDINSSHLIYELLNEQKGKGIGIIYVGEDLDILMDISDRIMIMYQGENKGIVTQEEIRTNKVTKQTIGLMMIGLTKEEALNKISTSNYPP